MRWMQNLAAMARSNTASMFMVYNVPMQRFILCLLAVLASASALAANQMRGDLRRRHDPPSVNLWRQQGGCLG